MKSSLLLKCGGEGPQSITLNRKYFSSNVKLKMSLEESVRTDQAKKREKYASETGTCTFVCISLPMTVELGLVRLIATILDPFLAK